VELVLALAVLALVASILNALTQSWRGRCGNWQGEGAGQMSLRAIGLFPSGEHPPGGPNKALLRLELRPPRSAHPGDLVTTESLTIFGESGDLSGRRIELVERRKLIPPSAMLDEDGTACSPGWFVAPWNPALSRYSLLVRADFVLWTESGISGRTETALVVIDTTDVAEWHLAMATGTPPGATVTVTGTFYGTSRKAYYDVCVTKVPKSKTVAIISVFADTSAPPLVLLKSYPSPALPFHQIVEGTYDNRFPTYYVDVLIEYTDGTFETASFTLAATDSGTVPSGSA
jgi:hypothetical protein